MMKKKLLTLGLVSAMVCSIAACNKTNVTPAEPAVTSEVTSVAVTPASEETPDSEIAAASEISAPVVAPDFAGDYHEEIAGRGNITITPTGEENQYNVTIHWGSSAFESAEWTMTATYYDSTGLLEYSDGTYFVRTYEDEEHYNDDVKYTDGGGCFSFEENGKLGWQSAESGVDGIDGSSFFVRNEYVDFEAE